MASSAFPPAWSALTPQLERIAKRLATDERFIAAALARYQQVHGLDDAELAAQLGCPVAALPLLALCRRPLPSDLGFAVRVWEVATWRIPCNAGVLTAILRTAV